MTDITRKLELIGNLKPKEMWPTELGPEFGETNNWCTALSAICSEALAEIQRLRSHERASEKWLAELVPDRPFVMPNDWRYAMRTATIEFDEIKERSIHPQDYGCSAHYFPCNCAANRMLGKSATQVIIDDPHASEPELEQTPQPWGSAFAMNTENWQ